VVFCRYIATAHYLGRHLAAKLQGRDRRVVTGDFTSDERGEGRRAGRRRATCCSSRPTACPRASTCRSHFDAVVHYDLSWNPTRHEQREGRVDRFGQERPVVRATLIYGANNPVDGAVLEVILRKADKHP
jgi:hypothetical protein